MAGFDWNQLYSVLKYKIEKASTCTVGRYIDTKPSSFPYVDISLGDSQGIGYSLDGNEGATEPLIVIDVYMNTDQRDSKCYEVSMAVKEIFLSYGFRCITQPRKTTSTDSSIARWTTRYQRVFGSGDDLTILH